MNSNQLRIIKAEIKYCLAKHDLEDALKSSLIAETLNSLIYFEFERDLSICEIKYVLSTCFPEYNKLQSKKIEEFNDYFNLLKKNRGNDE